MNVINKTLGAIYLKSLFKNRRFHSLMVRFTVWYIVNLFFVMAIIGIIIIISTSYYLLNNNKHDTLLLEDKLIAASQEKQVDWQEAIDNLLYPGYGNFYVKISNSKGKTIAHSHGWDQVAGTNHKAVGNGKLIKKLLFETDQGIYYSSSVPWTQRNGEKGTIIVISQLNHISDFLSLLAKVLIMTTLFGGLLGSIIIYFVTKRNIKPLKSITNSVGNIKDFSDLKKRVPIPNGPHELTTLAKVFNALLIKLEEQFTKERSFVSNASHELRTPITAFMGHISLLNRWGKKDPEILDQSINALNVEGKRMQRLIDQLLTLAHTDSPNIERREVNLGSVVIEAKQEITTVMDHPLDIQMEIDKRIILNANPDQLRQVAIILIDNAMKYTNTYGKIRIAVFRENGWGIFKITDTGIGIEMREIPLIFERFYRVEKARSRKKGGSGLGLSIAREIIESHNGTIEVKSQIGVGSTFIVKIPLG